MITENNQPREKKNSDFGLPHAEFKPLAEGGRRWLKVTVILVSILLVISAGVLYWFLYCSPASRLEKAPLDLNEAPDFREPEAPTISQAPLEGDQEEGKKNTFAPHFLNHPEEGTVTKVDSPQSYYYIVVGSFIDGDLASEHANRLAKQGIDITILVPKLEKGFFRVAVAQANTLHAAHEKIEALKATYGHDIWIKKY